jgi:putative ABC transport system permease protein
VIRHALQLIWNRKRSNALILLEIFFSFLVVLVVATLAIYYWTGYRSPLGFDYRDVWGVEVDLRGQMEKGPGLDESELFQRLLREIGSLEPVEAVGGAFSVPYEGSTQTESAGEDGRNPLLFEVDRVTDGIAGVLRMETVRGRWFEPADAALAWIPVVIDEDLARAKFGTADPVGRTFREAAAGTRERRVIGVVRDFRRSGELSARDNFLLELWKPNEEERALRSILIRLRPGTPAAFEQDLIARLRGVARDADFEVRTLAQRRDDYFQSRLAPLLAGGTVAAFLLLMVGLGLVGVLWQNLIRRTREIGLRRAAGASRANLQRQILIEQLLLSTLGIGLAMVLAFQLPLLGVTRFVPAEALAGGMVMATLVIYLLTALCALYPSWMASRLPPAEALRYE